MKRSSILAALILVLSACVSPASRIRDNPAAFASLTPEQQALVKDGKIALGMPQAAVQMALGKPDRVTEHTDANGVEHVWHYTDVDYAPPAMAYPYWGPYPYFYDPLFYPVYPVYAPYPTAEYDRIRVVFNKDGLVSAIEREM